MLSGGGDAGGRSGADLATAGDDLDCVRACPAGGDPALRVEQRDILVDSVRGLTDRSGGGAESLCRADGDRAADGGVRVTAARAGFVGLLECGGGVVRDADCVGVESGGGP